MVEGRRKETTVFQTESRKATTPWLGSVRQHNSEIQEKSGCSTEAASDKEGIPYRNRQRGDTFNTSSFWYQLATSWQPCSCYSNYSLRKADTTALHHKCTRTHYKGISIHLYNHDHRHVMYTFPFTVQCLRIYHFNSRHKAIWDNILWNTNPSAQAVEMPSDTHIHIHTYTVYTYFCWEPGC